MLDIASSNAAFALQLDETGIACRRLQNLRAIIRLSSCTEESRNGREGDRKVKAGDIHRVSHDGQDPSLSREDSAELLFFKMLEDAV